MSESVKKSSSTELSGEIQVVSPSGISMELQMDKTMNLKTELSTETAFKLEDFFDNCEESETGNIAQYGINTKNNLAEYDAANIEDFTECEKEVLADLEYWDQNSANLERRNKSLQKYPASQRLTVTKQKIMTLHKTVPRDPTYFKFDRSTTATLETLIAKKYLGSLHNVVSRGKNSVIINADNPKTSEVVNVWFSAGTAVKVYQLTNDVKKNIVILKRAQREYEHLQLLRCCHHVPHIVHKMKNVLISGFIGRNHETAQTITKLESKHFPKVYQMIVDDMCRWYTKCQIVHGNLCTKNVLFVDVGQYSYYDNPFFLTIIGWGHSVKLSHPQALRRLMKDCHFITNFFRRRDVPVKSVEELFKHITGLDKISHKVLESLNMDKKDLWQEGQLTNPNR